jgi:hypothetical protein
MPAPAGRAELRLFTAATAPRHARNSAQLRRLSDSSDCEPRIIRVHATPKCSECVRGRLPLPEALGDELGPLLLAPTVEHLEV